MSESKIWNRVSRWWARLFGDASGGAVAEEPGEESPEVFKLALPGIIVRPGEEWRWPVNVAYPCRLVDFEMDDDIELKKIEVGHGRYSATFEGESLSDAYSQLILPGDACSVAFTLQNRGSGVLKWRGFLLLERRLIHGEGLPN